MQVSLAIKYASRNRHMNLAQRLDELAQRKAAEEAAAVEQEDDTDENGYEDYVEESKVERTSRGRSKSIGRGNERKNTRDEVEDDGHEEVMEEEVEENDAEDTDEGIVSKAKFSFLLIFVTG